MSRMALRGHAPYSYIYMEKKKFPATSLQKRILCLLLTVKALVWSSQEDMPRKQTQWCNAPIVFLNDCLIYYDTNKWEMKISFSTYGSATKIYIF